MFLNYSLQQVLLQSEEELLAKRSSEIGSEGTVPKPKKIIGKMKVQGNSLSPDLIFSMFKSLMMRHS